MWWLRSSPTPGGRCWRGRWKPTCSGAPEVAILTDPGGPVPSDLPRRPRGLRSSPTPGGRCWCPCPADRARLQHVAILTDPGGPVLGSIAVLVLVWALEVAILTDPGGPVLVSRLPVRSAAQSGLRSSPTPGGRCWHRAGAVRPLTHGLRSSPTPGGRCWPHRQPGKRRTRCCDPHRPRGAGAGAEPRIGHELGAEVAILTDPGGPVLVDPAADLDSDGRVAILTDPVGPVLAMSWSRPGGDVQELRSSPTPGGRCWTVGVRVRAAGLPVAILTDPGGRCWDTDAGQVQGPAGVAILRPRGAGAGSPSTPRRLTPTCCDPHRPRGAGAGSAAWSCSSPLTGLRSSPTPGGRCWPPQGGRDGAPGWRCDPHRPRGAGAGGADGRQETGDVLKLRSSPTPGGRCWGVPVEVQSPAQRLRSSPTPGGRCWPRWRSPHERHPA